MKLPWSQVGRDLASDENVKKRCVELRDDVRHHLVANNLVGAARSWQELRVGRMYVAMGYRVPDEFWSNELPEYKKGLKNDLMAGAAAVTVAPKLAELLVSGDVKWKDIVDTGKLVRFLHSQEDAMRVALEPAAKRQMLLAVAKDPVNKVRPNTAGPGRPLTVPHELLKGEYKTVLYAYKKYARDRDVPLRYYRRPSFGVVVSWLIDDWMRMRKRIKKLDKECQPG